MIDDEMSDADIASHFGEPAPEPEKESLFPEEDLYAIAARVKNAAREAVGFNLTPAGEALCNTHVHAIKELYEFSHTLNVEDRARMVDLIRKQETMAANFISSVPPPKKVQRTITPTLNPEGPKVLVDPEPVYLDEGTKKLVEAYMSAIEPKRRKTDVIDVQPTVIKQGFFKRLFKELFS